MLNLNTTLNRFNEHWDEIKSEMYCTWRNIKIDEVEKINNYKDLIKQLKKSYHVTGEEAVIEVNKFIKYRLKNKHYINM